MAGGVVEPNTRLRAALDSQGITTEALAHRLEVDPKTVQRWISTGRRPYPRIAHQAARLLNLDVAYLWPVNSPGRGNAAPAASDEIVACYPGRATVPAQEWSRLLDDAQQVIQIIGDFGLVHVVTELADQLRRKAAAGVKVEIVLSDPAQATDPGTAAAAATAAATYQPLAGEPGIQVASYLGTLHTMLLRIDNDIVVRMPLDGCPAAFAPFLHLRALTGGPLARVYLSSIDAIKELTLPTKAPTLAHTA